MRESRILAMGGSNVNGFGLDYQEDSWPMLLAAALQSAHGHPVTVVRSYLYIEAAGPAAFIAKRIAEHNPDIVLFSVSGPAFVLKTVANSVGRLAGKRMRRALIVAEMKLQNAVGSLGDRNVPVRRLLKRSLRKALSEEASFHLITETIVMLDCQFSLSPGYRFAGEANDRSQASDENAGQLSFNRVNWLKETFNGSKGEQLSHGGSTHVVSRKHPQNGHNRYRVYPAVHTMPAAYARC